MAKKATVSRSSVRSSGPYLSSILSNVLHDTDGQIQKNRKRIKKIISPADCIIVGADLNDLKQPFPAFFPDCIHYAKFLPLLENIVPETRKCVNGTDSFRQKNIQKPCRISRFLYITVNIYQSFLRYILQCATLKKCQK